MSNSDIITNQFVRISQTPASIGERIVARIIDGIIIFLYIMGIALLGSIFAPSIPEPLGVFFTFLWLIPIVFYDFLWETFNKGQSPGKHLMKIKVVNKDGSRPTLGSFFMRWLLNIIDLGMSCIGMIFIIFTKNSQRLGDLAAGTMVVKLVDYSKYHVSLDEFYYVKKDYRPVYEEAKNLSQGQIDVIEKTLYSTRDDQEQQIAVLAGKVEKFLHISPKENSKEAFLATILHDYQYYVMELI